MRPTPSPPERIEPHRVVHLAEGNLSLRNAKMTVGLLRYGYHESVAIIDSNNVGRTAAEVLGIGGTCPVVSTFEDAAAFNPTALVVGITPPGGRLPAQFRPAIRLAIRSGCDIICGLHEFLCNDPEFSELARQHRVHLHDLRRAVPPLPVGGGLCRWAKPYVSLFVGTDCAIGKMTAALECDREARSRGLRSGFVATGQVGIAIAGWGSPVDAIAGDFMAGCVERDVLSLNDEADIVWVEGQGALHHPGFSAVSLGLLHGACPDSIVLCHQLTRTGVSHIREMPIPPLADVVELNLAALRPFRPNAKLIAVALNSVGVPDELLARRIVEIEAELGVPVTDPVRMGPGPIVQAAREHRTACGKG